MTQFYPNGIGAFLGDVLATCRPLQMSGNVWYVSSYSGTDAASPRGQQREFPLATIGQAHTNAVAGDIIVCLDGHGETLTATQTFNKAGITLVGEGSNSGVPTVGFSINSAAVSLFNVTAAGVKFRNFRVRENDQLSVASKITWAAANGEMRNCYVACGAKDVASLSLGAGSNSFCLRSSTFVSTTTTNRPGSAVFLSAAVSDLDILDCVFDGGELGFSASSVALDLSLFAVTRLRGESVSMIRGADASINAATIGYFNIQTSTGGSRVSW